MHLTKSPASSSHLADIEDMNDIQKTAFIHVALVICVDDITSNLNTKAHDLELLVRDWLNLLNEREKKLKQPRTIPASEKRPLTKSKGTTPNDPESVLKREIRALFKVPIATTFRMPTLTDRHFTALCGPSPSKQSLHFGIGLTP